MQTPLVLLKFVAKAALNAVGFGIAGDFAMDVLPQMSRDIWGRWGKDRSEAERKAEVQALVQAPADEVKQQVKAIVREVAGDRPPEVQVQLETYLNQIPTVARQSLRRRDDPRGVTVPLSRGLQKPEDLLPLLPTRLPRFKPGDRPIPNIDRELVELLGVGGFGEVWKARNPRLQNHALVALKFCLDPAAKERLLDHEAGILDQVMRQGVIPGIVQLRNTYLSADPPCLEYEFIEGGDLAGLLFGQLQKNPAGFTPETVRQIILRLAKTMSFAHKLKPPVVHRDLKPANVLVQRSGDNKVNLRITDFGIGGVAADKAIEETRHGQSRYLQVTAVRGAYSPLYASPQQMEGTQPDPRDDVYALGIMWYQLLIGDLTKGAPAGGGWRRALSAKGVTDEALSLLEQCFETDVAERLPSAVVLALRLEELLQPKPPVEPARIAAGSEPTATTARKEPETAAVSGNADAQTQTKQETLPKQQTVAGGDSDRTNTGRPETRESPQQPHDPTVTRSRREDTLKVLARHSIIQWGSEIEILPEARPRDADQQNQKLFRAKIGDLARQKSIVWLHDNSAYSLTNLLEKLCQEHGVQWVGGKTASNWRVAGHTENLWDEAERLRNQKQEVSNELLESKGLPEVSSASIEVNVPGMWRERLVGDAEDQWTEEAENGWTDVVRTPTRVQVEPGKMYELQVDDEVIDAQLVALADLSNRTELRSLDLGGCKRVTDIGLTHLRALVGLRSLVLGECEELTDAGLAYLCSLTGLRSLNLGWCKWLTDAGLARLSGLISLRSLNLKVCEQLTDAGLMHLRGLHALQTLNLGWCKQLTDAGLAHLRGLTALQHLDLSGCQQLTDVGLAHLRDLTTLQHLDLWGCKHLTDTGLAHLRGLTTLQHLGLGLCERLTDAGLAHLRGLTALQHLDLWECQRLTDVGLAHLRGITTLQRLELLFCGDCTATGVDALREALPNCDISSSAW